MLSMLTSTESVGKVVFTGHLLSFLSLSLSCFRYCCIFLAASIITPVMLLITYDLVVYGVRLLKLPNVTQKFTNGVLDLKNHEKADNGRVHLKKQYQEEKFIYENDIST